MSRQAVQKVAFIAKAPQDRQDLHWILNLADKIAERPGRRSSEERRELPDNVIPFPGCR
ncbi:hypothetical protein [Haloferula helveola]|uniref:hypothetical protein n=1 Tax=Haloferula helveola TaxID=490095 RepID=UPI0030B10AF5